MGCNFRQLYLHSEIAPYFVSSHGFQPHHPGDVWHVLSVLLLVLVSLSFLDINHMPFLRYPLPRPGQINSNKLFNLKPRNFPWGLTLLGTMVHCLPSVPAGCQSAWLAGVQALFDANSGTFGHLFSFYAVGLGQSGSVHPWSTDAANGKAIHHVSARFPEQSHCFNCQGVCRPLKSLTHSYVNQLGFWVTGARMAVASPQNLLFSHFHDLTITPVICRYGFGINFKC